jgi:uncharacterized membrane protein
MNKNQKRSMYTLLIWSVVAAIFIPLFFINGGADTWGIDSRRFIISTSFLLVGYISFFIMLALTRGKKASDIDRDERDVLIGRKASEITLTVVTGYVFLTCIVLYTIYEKINFIPRGWMWFLGYTCIFTGYIAYSAINLILYGSKANIR